MGPPVCDGRAGHSRAKLPMSVEHEKPRDDFPRGVVVEMMCMRVLKDSFVNIILDAVVR